MALQWCGQVLKEPVEVVRFDWFPVGQGPIPTCFQLEVLDCGCVGFVA